MTEKEQRQWVNIIASMAVDRLSGGISWETFKTNIRTVVKRIDELEPPDMPKE